MSANYKNKNVNKLQQQLPHYLQLLSTSAAKSFIWVTILVNSPIITADNVE